MAGVPVWKWRRHTTLRMLKFMLPALVLPLADPIMTLIDTICVGRFTGSLELASLGPSSIVFSFFSYVFNALGIATTASVAAQLKGDDASHASVTASAALVVALACGIVSSLLMQAVGPQLIAVTGAAMEVRSSALEYLRIRAFAQPALLVCLVTQSALLAQRDSTSPSASVLLQIVVNFILDIWLIAGLGWGVVGAAWGTVVAQYLGMLLLLERVQRRDSFITLSLRVPALKDIKELWKTLAPLSVMYIAKNLSYLSIQVAAATLAPLQLAAHQAVWSMFNLCAFSNTTLEQAGLAFHPLAQTPREVQETTRLLIAMGVANGCLTGLICFVIAIFYPGVFTKDAAVYVYMAVMAPFCALTLVLVGTDVGCSTNLVALGKAQYLARAFLVCLAVLAPLMTAVVRLGLGIQGVWSGLVVFFSLRCLQSCVGVSRLPQWRRSDGSLQLRTA